MSTDSGLGIKVQRGRTRHTIDMVVNEQFTRKMDLGRQMYFLEPFLADLMNTMKSELVYTICSVKVRWPERRELLAEGWDLRDNHKLRWLRARELRVEDLEMRRLELAHARS